MIGAKIDKWLNEGFSQFFMRYGPDG